MFNLKKFLGKLNKLYEEYCKISDEKTKLKFNFLKKIEEKERKINEFIDNRSANNEGGNLKSFANFNIKGSFLHVLCRFILNKKTIIILSALFIFFTLNRLFKNQFNSIFSKFAEFPMIKNSLAFLKGLVVLLVEY